MRRSGDRWSRRCFAGDTQSAFYEKDVPYYASTRDLWELPPGGRLRLYSDLGEVHAEVKRDLDDADLALCTSYCPDGPAACDLILESKAAVKCFLRSRHAGDP